MTTLDLSTATIMYNSGVYQNGTLKSTDTTGVIYFMLGPELDPTKSYTLEIDMVMFGSPASYSMTMYGSLGPTPEDADMSTWSHLGYEGRTDLQVGQTHTLTQTIGPGIFQWDAAAAANEMWPFYEVKYGEVTAMRLTEVGAEPAAPTLVSEPSVDVVSQTRNSVTLRVESSQLGATHEYEIVGSGGTQTGSTTATEFTVEGLTPSTKYYVRARVTGSATSLWSMSRSFTTESRSHARLQWSRPENRFFETGLDRGVLYPKKTPPPGALQLVNMMPNPSFELSKAGWNNFTSGITGTVSIERESDPDTPYGGYALRVTASGLGGTTDDKVGIQSDPIPVKPNQSYVASAEFGGTLPTGKHVYIWVEILDASMNIIEGGSGGGVSAGRFSNHHFTNMNAAYMRVYLWVSGGSSGAVSAVNVTMDGVMLTEGSTLYPYFDGSTESNAVNVFTWAGAEHFSRSEKREATTLATPWDGLTSVEESGGEAARAYYADGRPFLFLPIPKEYSATISAYTYPDAFSEIMGLTEATDGMYLDSQAGAPFDLSYRTKVGNALEGLDHAYKIHLVYNATVTPGGVNYESLADSINPSTMSWEVKAVPVRVEGFRPTAHIVIDTRHMDPNTIEALEDLLYGSDAGLPSMPSPQLVFDLLNYGDTILVTDNGDGTFEVEGSYENVYLVGDGEFRVDNVDGQDNGDGTFTISTTNG